MKQILPFVLAASLVLPTAATAAVSDEDFQQLRDQLAALSARLEELAAENAELRKAQEESATAISDVQATVAEAPAVAAAPTNWSDRIAMDGDFRALEEQWMAAVESGFRDLDDYLAAADTTIAHDATPDSSKGDSQSCTRNEIRASSESRERRRTAGSGPATPLRSAKRGSRRANSRRMESTRPSSGLFKNNPTIR